ncbi:MAG: sigma-70 family RNA polymerase sigma factor [Planctomycetes bacterium]|nr:sigma-70 family RNA polymerase sigma factor [Planctomycetota bacterium]
MSEPVEHLIQSASRGEPAAVEELLTRYLPALRAFVRLRADPALRARESDSDLVQSTCRAILQRAGQFQFGGEEGFKRWLFTTALRTMIDKHARWRTEKRAGPRTEHDDELGLEYYRSFSSPSQQAMARETRERIEQAFSELEEEEREVISLARVAGLSHREIGLAMNRSEGATRVLLHRSLVHLARRLDTSP